MISEKLILAGMFVLAFSVLAVAQDRMPAIPLEKMNDLQKKYAEEIIKGPRGALYGPFVPLIRSPELMDKAQRMGEYLRFKSAIGNKLSELVILVVARQWTQQVEWYIHEPIAIKVGIKPEVVRAIAEGRRPTAMPEDEEIVYDFCTSCMRTSAFLTPPTIVHWQVSASRVSWTCWASTVITRFWL